MTKVQRQFSGERIDFSTNSVRTTERSYTKQNKTKQNKTKPSTVTSHLIQKAVYLGGIIALNVKCKTRKPSEENVRKSCDRGLDKEFMDEISNVRSI